MSYDELELDKLGDEKSALFFLISDKMCIRDRIGAELGLPVRSSSLILEGGAIEGNGDGVLVTTESVLLNPNRNPDWSLAMIEE